MSHISVGKKNLPYKDSKFVLKIFIGVNDDGTSKIVFNVLEDPFILMRLVTAFHKEDVDDVSYREYYEMRPSSINRSGVGKDEKWHEMIISNCPLPESQITAIINEVFDNCKQAIRQRETCDRICRESGLVVIRWFYHYTITTRIYAKSEYFEFRESVIDYNTDTFKIDPTYQAVCGLKAQVAKYLNNKTDDDGNWDMAYDQEAKMEAECFIGQISVAESKIFDYMFKLE